MCPRHRLLLTTTYAAGLRVSEVVALKVADHIVPERFVRIRHFGVLANRARQTKLTRCRQLLACAPVPAPPSPESVPALMLRLTGLDIERCAVCGHGRVCRVERLPLTLARRPRPTAALDTS